MGDAEDVAGQLAAEFAASWNRHDMTALANCPTTTRAPGQVRQTLATFVIERRADPWQIAAITPSSRSRMKNLATSLPASRRSLQVTSAEPLRSSNRAPHGSI